MRNPSSIAVDELFSHAAQILRVVQQEAGECPHAYAAGPCRVDTTGVDAERSRRDVAVHPGNMLLNELAKEPRRGDVSRTGAVVRQVGHGTIVLAAVFLRQWEIMHRLACEQSVLHELPRECRIVAEDAGDQITERILDGAGKRREVDD